MHSHRKASLPCRKRLQRQSADAIGHDTPTTKPRFLTENEAIYEDSDFSESVKVPGLEPGTYGLKVRGKARKNADVSSVVAQMVATDAAENDCERLISAGETDPDLARLVAAWPKLTAMVKRMIMAALDASHEGEQSGTAAPHGNGVPR